MGEKNVFMPRCSIAQRSVASKQLTQELLTVFCNSCL